MGKVQVGILDGFVGKVGTVVGSFWKGLPVMRAYKRVVKDANTTAQQVIRVRFAAAGGLASAFLYAIRIGFKQVARSRKITEGDYFIKKNWESFHADNPSAVTIDYTELSLAQGNLPEVLFGNASFAEPLQVAVTMTDTTGVIGADANDIVYMFVYSPEAGAGVISDGRNKRSDASMSVNVPAYWNGHRVHVWGFALGNGADNKGIVSNSRYLGSGVIS